MKKIIKKIGLGVSGLALVFSVLPFRASASSHSEAPLISMDRYADNTDTYAFRSVEPGREGFVTIIANWIPFQEPSGGPQYYRFDDSVLYEIKIDNTGDGVPDVTYQFQFKTNTVRDTTVLGMSTLNEDAVITSLTDPDYNQYQTYSVRRIDANGPRLGRQLAVGLRTPPSNIGPRTTPNYEQNLGQPAIYNLPSGGKVFAGQRDEYFYVDVGGVFDTLNLRSIGANGGVDSTQGYNVSSVAIEVPISDLTKNHVTPTSPTDPSAVVGVWATASRRAVRVIGSTPDNTPTPAGHYQYGQWVQVSRLGNPLVNEVVIPLGLKDAFNAITPVSDAVAAPAILDPELAHLMQAVFGINIPPPPRNDLVQIFATGIPVNDATGPNYSTFLSDGQPHEYLRLNVAIPITPIGSINRLGLLGGDVAGFPNGRRPHDDVVDIELRAVAGGTPFTPATNVSPNNALGDGVSANPEGPLLTRFPYLLPPNPGNTPRASNQTAAAGVARDFSKPPVVDKDGHFVR